jgi:carbonic anhydrase
LQAVGKECADSAHGRAKVLPCFSVKLVMGIKTFNGSPAMRLKYFFAICVAVMPAVAAAAWQIVSAEASRRVEIERASIKKDDAGRYLALGRIILEKPINDPKTSSSYRIIEALNRYDCAARLISTLKRSYFKEEGDLLREEEVRTPTEMPVHSGSLDDKLLREVCRPKSGGEARVAASKTVELVNEAAGELRKANEVMLEKEGKRVVASAPAVAVPKSPKSPKSRKSKSHPAEAHAQIHWGYEGAGGPENWGKLNAGFATCAKGARQSPIDIRDGIRVDLEPIQFAYRPSLFRVVDNGHTVQVTVVGGGSISLLGKSYQLIQFHFHRPSEELVNGKSFDMVAHLVHKSEDGKLAVVAVLLEKGGENWLIQTVWNNLPLEKGSEVAPPATTLDPAGLLPDSRGYYTYMGSLTTPPCSEDVLWLVLKQPQQMSVEQMAVFARLYKSNARPVQSDSGRMIKESR